MAASINLLSFAYFHMANICLPFLSEIAGGPAELCLWAFSFSSMANTTLEQGEQVRDLKAQQFQVVLEDGEILVLFRFWVELGKLGPPDKGTVLFLLFRDRYRDARQADTLAHLPYIVFIEV